MDHTYTNHKQPEKAASHQETAELQSPSMATLRSGAAMPTPKQKGNPVDLPNAMRAKMENAFGADLSAVKLYESQAVADAGAKAITQGSEIAFAPGMLDFTSFGGQALLGHEISHVVSQARGEVTGGGFLNDHALEARADREGAMAAAGEQIAMPTAAMSTVSAASAAGPMQAKDKDKDEVPDTLEPKTAWIFPTGDPELDKQAADEGDRMADEKFWRNTDPSTQTPKNDIFREKIMQHEQQINSLSAKIDNHTQQLGNLTRISQNAFQTSQAHAMQLSNLEGMTAMMGGMGMQMPMMDMGMAPQQAEAAPASPAQSPLPDPDAGEPAQTRARSGSLSEGSAPKEETRKRRNSL